MVQKTLDNMKVERMPINKQVFYSMKDAIKNGVWKLGEKIPSEMDLSEMFGVNRLTVRMAMQRLISMGLVESRVGDGTYVKEFSFANYLKCASEFYLGSELLDKVYEFRNAIELQAARLAIIHSTEEEIVELEEICVEFEKLKNEYMETRDENILKEVIKTDVEFHEKICENSHNELFVYAFEMVKDLLSRYIEIVMKERIKYWEAQREKEFFTDDLHRIICTSIKNKDFETCKNAYNNVVDYKIDL